MRTSSTDHLVPKMQTNFGILVVHGHGDDGADARLTLHLRRHVILTTCLVSILQPNCLVSILTTRQRQVARQFGCKYTTTKQISLTLYLRRSALPLAVVTPRGCGDINQSAPPYGLRQNQPGWRAPMAFGTIVHALHVANAESTILPTRPPLLNGTLHGMQRWDRFDILIKVAYARHFLAHGALENSHPAGAQEGSHPTSVTPFAVAAYTEHVRAMNNFFEKCFRPSSQYFQPQHYSHPSCTPKHGPASFLDSFHALLLSMRGGGYTHAGEPNTTSIPVCRAPRLYAINGAHRISAAIALGLPSVPMHVMPTCPRPH